MSVLKKIIIVFLVIVCYSSECISQSKVLLEGEELEYIVYYGFVKLGEIKMKVLSKRADGDKTIYSLYSKMKSYDGIPFVSLNSVFESDIIFNGKEMYSKRFKATEYSDEEVRTIEYKFNYDSNYTYVKKMVNEKIERDEKINFNKNVKFQDGLSLFYNSRLNSFSSDNFLIPVFMNEMETSVNYYFSSKPEDISVSFIDKDLTAILCNGTANFTGVFGLTGDFAGWFSNDEARVPLKSQMNVVIGNVTLELMSYKRSGWKP
ncbi:MAG: DUF3108 domain-containing protein [Ignavibacteria bacterium]